MSEFTKVVDGVELPLDEDGFLQEPDMWNEKVAEAFASDEGVEAMRRSTLLGKVAEPEDLAATVVGIACPRISGYTTGQIFAANGGMYLA